MIEVNQCSKKFGMLQAVNKVSLQIGNREVFAAYDGRDHTWG